MILQSVVLNRIRQASTNIETVTTTFSLGPLRFNVVANLPDKGESGSTYVQVELMGMEETIPYDPKNRSSFALGPLRFTKVPETQEHPSYVRLELLVYGEWVIWEPKIRKEGIR
jgi:hypothetical protein